MGYKLLDDSPRQKGTFRLLEDAPDATGTFTENLAAGVGKSIYDLGRGGAQILRKGLETVGGKGLADRMELTTEADAAEARKMDDQLMGTAGGMTGNIAGNVAASLLVPGAGTYRGAMAAGAALGGLQPTVDGESRLANTALGTTAGVVGKFGGDKIAGAITGRLASREAAAAATESQNVVRDAALAAGREAGYVVPPRMVQTQNPVMAAIEGFGGKIKTEQLASNKNQVVTNKLARQALGIQEDVPITPTVLNNIRAEAGKAYEALRGAGTITADKEFTASLAKITQKYQGAAKDFPELAKNEIGDIVASVNKPTFSADAAIDAISILRDRATAAFAKGDKSLGSAYKQTSQAMEDAIERNLLQNAPEGVKAFQAARRLIAKTYTVEKALGTSGDVSAGKIAANLTKGKPLTDELRTIGEFAGSFKKATQDVAKVEPYSVIDAGMAALLGSTGGLPAAALPLARPIARSAVLSETIQDLLSKPSYGVSPVLRGAASGSRALPYLLPGASAGAITNGR